MGSRAVSVAATAAARTRVVPRVVVALCTVTALACAACTSSPSPGAGTDQPAALTIAVDLPFQGEARDVSDDTLNAIRLYLEQVNYTAGGYTVALTSRDNSTAQQGTWDEAACRRNADEHIATAHQVAVIGTYNSGCTKVQLPVLNEAEGGPMLMVSHANTNAGLTGEADAGEPDVYFPTGLRAFARVIPSEVAQGPAAAQFAAEELGLARCLVLNDGERYGTAVAAAFAKEARRLGIEVVGEETWNPADANYVALFGRARFADPDCVYLGGQFDSNGARILRDKVMFLGDNEAVKVLAPDGFVGYPDLNAEPEAQGAYLTFPGLTTEVLTKQSAAAARFVADFAAEFGHEPRGEYAGYALYGVAALQVVLAAIERSDGTRRGVRDAVFSAGGITVPEEVAILGRETSIDPVTGDASARDVSIQQVGDGGAALVQSWLVG